MNSGVIVPRLNADRVDGVHAAGLLKKNDYDADRNGIVDSAAIAVRYADDGTTVDMARLDRAICITVSVVLAETTTVIASGGLSLQALAESTFTIYGRPSWSSDGGTSWTTLNGTGVEANPGGLNKHAAVPVDAVDSLAAGTYIFAIIPYGVDLQTGNDYRARCELTVMALTGLGSTTDVDVNSAGLNDTDKADN